MGAATGYDADDCIDYTGHAPRYVLGYLSAGIDGSTTQQGRWIIVSATEDGDSNTAPRYRFPELQLIREIEHKGNCLPCVL